MHLHTLGEITLSLSTIIYFTWFMPQLWLNYQRKDTEGLSYWMHGLLFMGYCADLMYGIGTHMQWQYRAVTIFGLISLFIEHIQIGRYGLHRSSEKLNYIIITLLVVILLTFSICNLMFFHHSKNYYNWIGMISNTCWFVYIIPQIIKNYHNKSTEGLSLAFVVISFFLTVLDVISAFSLGWDWPSLIGTPIALCKKSIVLWQFHRYKKALK